MIKAQHKPLDEIVQMIADYRRVLILGCETCVAVCFAGGSKEVALLASTLRLRDGGGKEFLEESVKRQCELEFIDEQKELIESADAVVSIACGVGMNVMAERFPDTPVLPGNNTVFMGASPELGKFAEQCVACGDCIIHWTGGLCPIARCAKHLFNGPCGGSEEGRCEISQDVPCIWQMIYERLSRLGQLERMEEIQGVRDWSTNDASGPRQFIREDLRVESPVNP
ncbi:MAG: methylenetetrahydrofolate reductase C-terminal domain-containing protein [Dehalococcoidia bacterium]